MVEKSKKLTDFYGPVIAFWLFECVVGKGAKKESRTCVLFLVLCKQGFLQVLLLEDCFQMSIVDDRHSDPVVENMKAHRTYDEEGSTCVCDNWLQRKVDCCKAFLFPRVLAMYKHRTGINWKNPVKFKLSRRSEGTPSSSSGPHWFNHGPSTGPLPNYSSPLPSLETRRQPNHTVRKSFTS
jgi:hypothetical protein